MITSLADLFSKPTPNTPFDVLVSDDEFNALAPMYLSQQSALPVQAVSFGFAPGLLKAAAEATVVGMQVAADMEGEMLVSEEGVVSFNPSIMNINGSPAPAFVKAMVINRINDRLASAIFPFIVEAVVISAGTMRVTGTTRAGE